MKSWEDAKRKIRSLSPSEIKEIEAAARLVVDANSTDVNFDHSTKVDEWDYVVLRSIERDCPICDKVHFIEERKRSTQGIVKGEIVDYEEIFYCCTTSDDEENEFVSVGLMDENLLRARNAYTKQRTGIPWEEVRAELLKDPETAQAVKDLEPEYEIIEARIKRGLTQEELAKSNTRRLGAGKEGAESRKIASAVKKLISEADNIAKGEKSGATMDDVFGVKNE